ncbi:MAG: hypothetical protein H0W16_07835 [Actinobacteria bacterium]|nr:hypothetical protein [Actinomycetota bacterium]
MPHTTPKRYAVVSCHVERPLDDQIWGRFAALQRRRPGGFPIAALMRPPDAATGEDEGTWLVRAREAAARGPLGHHTHWTAPDHARPTAGETGERVLTEGRRMRELGLEPSLFCGGGWYTDIEVAEACAELGYIDCTPRARRPPYLAANEAWASLVEPTRIRLPSERLLAAIPTTHSPGDLARDLLRWRSLPRTVHVYFHDTDLADRRRSVGLAALLVLLARLAEPTDLMRLADVTETAPEVSWSTVAQTSK